MKLNGLGASDEYYTRKKTWEDIKHLLPPNQKAWEPFIMNDDRSPRYMKELGIDVLYKKGVDFFSNNVKRDQYDYILSTPLFSKKKRIIKKLYDEDIPFILIFPVSGLRYQYLSPLKEHLQVIFPKQKMRFETDPPQIYTTESTSGNEPSFHCIYLCYKMNLDTNNLNNLNITCIINFTDYKIHYS